LRLENLFNAKEGKGIRKGTPDPHFCPATAPFTAAAQIAITAAGKPAALRLY